MLTLATPDIFKMRHPVHLYIVVSFGLLYALLASIELNRFTSIAKNPAWLTAIDEEVQALQNNQT